jgi:trimethylamine corrinoid protein
MTNQEMILTKMQASIENMDPDAAVLAAKEALAAGIDPRVALDEGFAVAIRKLGDAFERMDIFLPQLILGANAMKSGMAVLEEVIKAGGGTVKHKGIVVLGTVEGDIHDIGTTMLRQRDVLELLRNKGLSQRYFTIVGGAPVTQSWADEIGATAYGRDAIDAVSVLNRHAQEWAK